MIISRLLGSLSSTRLERLTALNNGVSSEGSEARILATCARGDGLRRALGADVVRSSSLDESLFELIDNQIIVLLYIIRNTHYEG